LGRQVLKKQVNVTVDIDEWCLLRDEACVSNGGSIAQLLMTQAVRPLIERIRRRRQPGVVNSLPEITKPPAPAC
jgi:hypothetical protein